MIPGAAWELPVVVAVGSNLDNLGGGLAVGMEGRRVGTVANLIVALLTAAATGGSILLGHLGSRAVPGALLSRAGGALLVAVGLVGAWRAWRRRGSAGSGGLPAVGRSADTGARLGIPEAVVLGVSLSVNNVIEGIGAGAVGLSALLTSGLAASCSLVFVGAGARVGHRGARAIGRAGPVLATAIFVGLGLRICLA